MDRVEYRARRVQEYVPVAILTEHTSSLVGERLSALRLTSASSSTVDHCAFSFVSWLLTAAT